jgi:large subunit ribosomal protein L19
MDIRELVEPKINPVVLQTSVGDTVKVDIKITEGDKERLQHFQGTVIRVRKGVDGGSLTVRKVSYGIGVEYTFPAQCPSLHNIEILRRGKVRRAKLYYMRQLSAKQRRLKERPDKEKTV